MSKRHLLAVVLVMMIVLLVVASIESGRWSLLLTHLTFGAACSWYGFKRGQALAVVGGQG